MSGDRLRVLHVIPGLGSGGGAERSLAATAEALVDELGQLHVAVLSERRALVDSLERVGVVVHDLSHARSIVQRARAIRRVVAAIEPDIVHASLVDADIPAQLAIGRSRPLVITWAGTPFAASLRNREGITWWKVQVVRHVETALGLWARPTYQAVTEGVARANSRALRVPPERVVIAERGRPTPQTLDDSARSRLRSALGVDDDVVLFLAVARHEPEKGLGVLVDAFALVVAAVPSARLVVAGREGSMTADIRDRIERRGLASSIELLGHRSDIDELLGAADVFASSSVTEGAAGAVLEAMSVGLPIIATEPIGLRGVLTDSVDALLVPIAEPASLSKAMLQVLRDPALAASLGQAASETFARRFTIDRSAAALFAMYRTLARDRP